MKIIKIKDSAPLTFKEWKKSEDYMPEINEAIDNFLYDDGEEVIKYWNDYCEKEGGDNASKYKYESVDEIKEDIESGANDIDNIVVGNKKLEEDLRLELESVYEKYHGMIKDDEEESPKWGEDELLIDPDEEDRIAYIDELLEEEYQLIREYKFLLNNPTGYALTVKMSDLLNKIIEEKRKYIDSLEGLRNCRAEFYDSKKTKKDANEIDFDYLLSEERKAVQDYKDSIAKTSDKSALYVLSHILKEESHHIELLENLRKGKVEFEDSKDDDDFDWGVKLVELSMDNIGDYETDGTPTHIYNIIDYNFFHQNYELLKSEIQKQMEHPEDMTEFEDEFYEFTDHDDLLDFVQNNYVLRRKYQDYIEQLNKKYGKFVREDQAEKTARKIIDKIKKDIKFRR